MTSLLEMSQSVMARGDRLSDTQLGLLLADLQLDAEMLTHREWYRVAHADGTATDSEVQDEVSSASHLCQWCPLDRPRRS
jgi:hypothetical protein